MSDTRLYLGNLPRTATKKDVEDFFVKHGHGTIQEIKLMNGFGFIEYSNPSDARDIVPIFHGKEFMDSRLTVQFARGPRPTRNDFNGPSGDRTPRPRRTPYRMNISGLPTDTSWQDLKDFARKSGVDVVFSEVSRNRDGSGIVEFETADDLRIAINKLDNYDFKGGRVSCTSDQQARNSRGRSRSPPPAGRRNGYSPREGRGYSPGRRGGYSPHRGGDRGYSPRGRGYSPPRGNDNRGGDRGFRERSPYGGGGREERRGGGGDYRGRYDEQRGGSGGGGRYDEPPRRYDDDKRGMITIVVKGLAAAAAGIRDTQCSTASLTLDCMERNMCKSNRTDR
ncbi:hypothetical protein TWF225_007820 [Orbilia oligospora]|nr:hypothetical protein TWF225_007820 [Orbilia oligospora]KAF3245678.1 hypothetical protein TWF128_009382 [Orbilia oligospora]KAF3257280.1 hypothetical protein TWF217_006025 [Orbilia oligospora]